jgi:hypothetical protein
MPSWASPQLKRTTGSSTLARTNGTEKLSDFSFEARSMAPIAVNKPRNSTVEKPPIAGIGEHRAGTGG